MDIWISDRQENELRKDGWVIPIKPETGPVHFKDKEVGFIDNFAGLSVEDDQREAIIYLVDNEDRIGYSLWNKPKVDRLWFNQTKEKE